MIDNSNEGCSNIKNGGRTNALLPYVPFLGAGQVPFKRANLKHVPVTGDGKAAPGIPG